ncbi:MAG: hypothetical protein ACFB00_04060 [Parvularculaceae bacterium]
MILNRRRPSFERRFFPRFAAGLILALAAGPALANEIFVSPLRQVLTPEAPVGTYVVSNPSRRIVEVRASLIDLAATPEGYASPTPAERAALSATPWLLLEPASFRLDPGARRNVTVRLRADAAPTGERRSHALIEAKAQRTTLRRTGGLGADIALSLSTPVIVRSGAGDARAKFGEVRLTRDLNGALVVEANVLREGAFSSYGRLEAVLKRRRGRPQLLAEIDNFAVYTDAPRTVARLPLGLDVLPTSTLTLRYVGAAEFDGRLFAKKSFAIEAPATR